MRGWSCNENLHAASISVHHYHSFVVVAHPTLKIKSKETLYFAVGKFQGTETNLICNFLIILFVGSIDIKRERQRWRQRSLFGEFKFGEQWLFVCKMVCVVLLWVGRLGSRQMGKQKPHPFQLIPNGN